MMDFNQQRSAESDSPLNESQLEKKMIDLYHAFAVLHQEHSGDLTTTSFSEVMMSEIDDQSSPMHEEICLALQYRNGTPLEVKMSHMANIILTAYKLEAREMRGKCFPRDFKHPKQVRDGLTEVFANPNHFERLQFNLMMRLNSNTEPQRYIAYDMVSNLFSDAAPNLIDHYDADVGSSSGIGPKKQVSGTPYLPIAVRHKDPGVREAVGKILKNRPAAAAITGFDLFSFNKDDQRAWVEAGNYEAESKDQSRTAARQILYNDNPENVKLLFADILKDDELLEQVRAIRPQGYDMVGGLTVGYQLDKPADFRLFLKNMRSLAGPDNLIFLQDYFSINPHDVTKIVPNNDGRMRTGSYNLLVMFDGIWHHIYTSIGGRLRTIEPGPYLLDAIDN